MDTLSEMLLLSISSYGAPLLGISLLAGALGIPIPTSLLLLASGAFVKEGLLSPQPAMLVSLISAVLGDSLSYTLGRLGKGWIAGRFAASPTWQQAGQAFIQRGGLAIFLTRWLFTALALPTNLAAGSSGYSFRRFLVFVLFGETTWIIIFGGLGYCFASQWEQISEIISNAGSMAAGLVILAAGTFLALRVYRQSNWSFSIARFRPVQR